MPEGLRFDTELKDADSATVAQKTETARQDYISILSPGLAPGAETRFGPLDLARVPARTNQLVIQPQSAQNFEAECFPVAATTDPTVRPAGLPSDASFPVCDFQAELLIFDTDCRFAPMAGSTVLLGDCYWGMAYCCG